MKHLVIALLLCAGSAFAQEDKLVALLKSDAPLNEKAAACRELARAGTGQSVPVLAALLTDEKLSHLACYALQPIADSSVDAALRGALGKLKGPSLAGVIGALGARKDAQAVAPLAQFLSDADPVVAHAAARALGSIGGAAAPVLEKALATASPANQPAICEGLFRCAEALSGARAAAIYDTVRALPNAPHHVRVAALSGAIRSRGANGVPLLVQAIRTESYVPVADAIRISMDMPGTEATQALAGELAQANPDKHLLLVQTLGNRGDATAAPALTPLAKAGDVSRRLAAIQSLVQIGAPASLPVLVALVKDPEAAVSSAALAGLGGFRGPEADATVLALVNGPDAGLRIAGIQSAALRRIRAAAPLLLQAAGDSDVRVADASFKALGELGGVSEIPGVVNALLQTKAFAAAENALSAIYERQTDPASSAEKLLPGLAKAKGEAKAALLRVLGALGGPQALAAVRAAAADPDPSAKETAQQVLCDWPAADALPDLAQITKTTPDAKLKLMALRAQLRLIPLQAAPEARQLSQLKELLPLIEQMKEQRQALATLGRLHSAESLALVMTYVSREGFQKEASVAAVAIAESIVAAHPAEVAAAMKQVQTKNEQLAGRVGKLLARAAAAATNDGFTSLFNGRDLTGWSGKPGWWTVEDGALTSESTAAKPCKECNYLIWRGGQPADFELLCEFKLSPSANLRHPDPLRRAPQLGHLRLPGRRHRRRRAGRLCLSPRSRTHRRAWRKSRVRRGRQEDRGADRRPGGLGETLQTGRVEHLPRGVPRTPKSRSTSTASSCARSRTITPRKPPPAASSPSRCTPARP